MSTIKRGEAPSLELIQTLQAEHEKHSAETTRMLEASQAQETHISDLLYTYLWAKTAQNPFAGNKLRLNDRPCEKSPLGRCVILEVTDWMDADDSEDCCVFCGHPFDNGKHDPMWKKPFPAEHLEFIRMMHANEDYWSPCRSGKEWVYKSYGASRRIAGELEEVGVVKFSEVWAEKVYKLTELGLKILETGKWPENM